MSELTRLRDEADRLLTTYAEHKDCEDSKIRLRVHVHLDRFLMENRETAVQMMLEGLEAEIRRRSEELHLEFEKPVEPPPGILQRLWRRLLSEREVHKSIHNS